MKKRIVIVEDELIIQELHKNYVENLGHEVVATFENGPDVIEYFKHHSADLILMDIRLEDGIDGIDTMKEIQKINPIPVVYISGNTEDVNFERAISTNMKAFLSKPINPNELEKFVDTVNDITDSMLYAKRIQEAMFLKRTELLSFFPKSMFINRPKDVISGDFSYLIQKKDENAVIGGVGDCTGHGIPGALLSVLCFEILALNSRIYSDLREIVEELNSSIIRNLSGVHNENRISDALDVILFKVFPETKTIQISGIKRPFIYYNSASQKHETISLKGISIGSRPMTVDEIPFVEMQYTEGDYFYFFTDGITDQFGGMNSKKIMRKGIIEFLDSMAQMPSLKREIELEIFLRKWQGSEEQTDDMLLLGFSPISLELKN